MNVKSNPAGFRALIAALINKDGEADFPHLSQVWLSVLLAAGGLLWCIFFNWGRIPFDFHDWAEVNAPRIAFVGDAVTKGELPLHMPDASALRNLTDRFFSLPDVIITPQMLLMRFMSVGSFILVDFLLLYTAACLGLIWLRKRYRLSLLVFTTLFLVFNFNGHVIAHLSVGHITWGGYFLFPWLVVVALRLLDGDRSWRWVTTTAGLLFLMFLQGSFHQFVWSLMFLGLLGLAAWRKFFTVLKALIFASLLSAVRILPPILLLGQFDTDFYGGYRLLRYIPDAMLVLRTPQQAMPFQNFNSSLGWWEFDLYVGMAGFAFLALGGLAWVFEQVKQRRPSPFLLPIIALAFFSLRNFYQVFSSLPIPLINAERVTSRMIILPIVVLAILGATALQRWLDARHSRPLATPLASLVIMLYLAVDLVRQVIDWRVTQAYAAFPHTPVNLAIKIVANHPDPLYTNLLLTGAVISLVSLGVLIYFTWQERKMAVSR